MRSPDPSNRSKNDWWKVMSLIRSRGISRPWRVKTPERTISRSVVTTKCVVRQVIQRQSVPPIRTMSATAHSHFRPLPTSPPTLKTRKARISRAKAAAATSAKYHQCGLVSTEISSPGFSRCRG
jgi:hypothetical protein